MEVRDPILGFIYADELETALIDCPPVQRLRYIHQLGPSYLVYPGARHSRFEHALGTMELAGRAFDSICRNSPDLVRTVFGDQDQQRWRATVRVAGLLHDVGHSPFSHASEALFADEVGSHEEITGRLICSDPLRSIITSTGTYRIDPEELAFIASGQGTPKSAAALLAKAIIADDLGVDRMDYLRRDSHMCGVSYGVYDLDRLVSTLCLARSPETDEITLALESGGMHAAEGLLTARYFMFSQVYYHDVRAVYDEHLIRFLRSHLPAGRYPVDLGEYLGWDDTRVLSLLRDHLETDRDAAALLRREHYRSVYESKPHELKSNPMLEEALRQYLSEFGDDVFVVQNEKKAVTISEGQVLVVNEGLHRVDDLLEVSTTLQGFSGIWHVRAFASQNIRTHVLDKLSAFHPVPPESNDEEPT